MKVRLIALFTSFIAYGVFGWWGLSLAIPPGFASAVWPAAGIALAFSLLCSSRCVYVGIGLASFVVNLSVSSDGWESVTALAMMPAFFISCGAILQAIVGKILFNRYVGKCSVLSISQNLFGFALIAAPLGCVVAATVGSLTLYSNNLLELNDLIFTWFTWWVGDTIGILLFTPLILSLFSTDSYLTFHRRAQIVVPTIFIFIGVWAFFLTSLDHNRDEQVANFIELSEDISGAIDKRVHVSENKLKSYSAFFMSSDNIDRKDFEQFSKVILQNDSVFHGIGWTEIIKHKDRKRIEASIRGEGFTDFRFTEFTQNGTLATSREYSEYYPVLYIYPLERNKKAFGLNLAANQERKEALLTAKKNALPIATAPITLAQETENMKATILYLPVFSLRNGNRNFMGFVSGVMRIKGILGDVLESARKKNVSISIMDITDTNHSKPLLFSHDKPSKSIQPQLYSMDFGGRSYQLHIYANENYAAYKKDWSSWMILTGGFFLSFLLLVFLLSIVNSIAVVDSQVKIKTRELRDAVQKAESANKAKSHFLANMSHELRTPLNAIIGFINLAKKQSDALKRDKFLTDAGLASNTLLGLINQSLDYAKIESGKLEIESQPISLFETLIKTQTIFNQQVEDKGLEFRVYVIGAVPDMVVSDPLRIEQVILNLISNAIKFTDSGYVSLTISAEQHGDSSEITLEVEDSGIGIANNNQSVFEAFKQEDSSTSRRYGGTGLGLSISRELAGLMGGGIELDSSYQDGCRFVVKLNLETVEGTRLFKHEDLVNSSWLKTSQEEVGLHKDCLKGVRILLVEDVLMNQIVAQEILESFGATIVVADNGQVALETLETDKAFQLVLMDLQMPVMDGYDATSAIRLNSELNSIPILAMTANAMDSDIEACIAVGMQGHISKPIEEQVMITKILRQLKLYSI